jgi:hypothetical protein
MTGSIVYRPAHPATEHNPFRQRTYDPQPLPSFADARPLLPQPILPQHPHWVRQYWQAWELVWSHLRTPTPENQFVSNYVASPNSHHLLMWDAAFLPHIGLYGRHAFNFLHTLDNLYARQHDDGFICRAIHMQTGQDAYPPYDPDSTGPNLLACTEWRYYRFTGDDSRLADVFWPLLAYHNWCRANRTWPNGLYWATGMSSGMSNQPRVPHSKHHHRHWSWVDATIQAALSVGCLAQIATRINEMDHAAELQKERHLLANLLNDQLWNEEMQFYQDRGPNGRFSEAKSIAAYWALTDKELVPEKRRQPFVQHLRETWAFNVAHRIPSLSADSDGYNYESGNGWRGGVWPPMNFMVLRGLHNIGQHPLAHQIALNHMQQLHQVYINTGAFWDYYAPETAVPGKTAHANHITSAITPISLLLEDLIGIGVEWPHRRVYWDRRLPCTEPFGVRNYPIGDGRMDLLADETKLSINTTVPFTLMYRDENQTMQTAVPAGVTELEL